MFYIKFMTYYALSGLINAIVAFGLGIIVFIKNRKGQTNIAFTLVALSSGFWSISYYLWTGNAFKI